MSGNGRIAVDGLEAVGKFRLLIVSVVAGVCSFFGVIALFELGVLGSGRSAQRAGSTDVASGPTRCEVEFGTERCRVQPSFNAMDQRGIYIETFENADKDADRCMRRADDYANWCKATQPITARFYRGRTVVKAVTQQ